MAKVTHPEADILWKRKEGTPKRRGISKGMFRLWVGGPRIGGGTGKRQGT